MKIQRTFTNFFGGGHQAGGGKRKDHVVKEKD